ncbi:MAG: hypothetical protein WHV44_01285 [Anaerolineales bacterium]
MKSKAKQWWDNFWQHLRQNWQWATSFLFVAGLSVCIWLLYPAFWTCPWGTFLLGLNILAIPVLFFGKGRSPNRCWRENRWIIVPAVVLGLVLLNSAWASAFISATYLQESQEKVFESHPGCKLHIRYPSYVVYERITPAKIHLRMVCHDARMRPLVVLRSPPQTLILSLAEQGNAWGDHLEITLPGDGTEVVLYARAANTNDKFLPLVINDLTSVDLPMKNADFEKHLKFFVNLLQSGSVFFTIIGAIIAGLKQLDEQKINERKRAIDALLSRMSNFKYENGKLNDLIKEIEGEIRDWDALWTDDQKSKFKEIYTELFRGSKDLWQEAARLPNASDFIKTAIAIFGIAGIDCPGTLKDLEIKYPGYKPESAAAYYPPEDYPLAKVLGAESGTVLDANNAPADNSHIDLWGMRFHPFGDWRAPYYYGKLRVKEFYFPLLDKITFSYRGARNEHQTYYFPTRWDLLAGLYAYCVDYADRSKPDLLSQSRETFFVPLFPSDLPSWRTEGHFIDYLLHALAGAWMRALAHNPYLIDENTPIEQQLVAELLVNRYGNSAAVKRALFAQFAHPELPLSPSTDFLKLLDQVSPGRIASPKNLSGLLSLRPLGTKYTHYLCAEIAPTGISHGTLSFYLHNAHIEDELRATQAFVVRFLLAGKQTSADQVLRMEPDALLSLLDYRIKLSTNNLSPQTFLDLFYPPPEQGVLDRFIRRANGSPGTIVKMAHDILAQHLEQFPDIPEISPTLLES